MSDGPELPWLTFEYANENRQATIALGGTGIALLTFLLIFLYDRFTPGDPGWYLFRGTLAVVVLSVFFLGISGVYYYVLYERVQRGGRDTRRVLTAADTTFALGTGLLMLEPSLILISLKIYDIGLLALVLFGFSIAFIAKERRLLETA